MIERCENSGIIFIDEIDKIAGAESKIGSGCESWGSATGFVADCGGVDDYDEAW